MITFTNPRHTAVMNDWPIGGGKRGTATFVVEMNPKRGQRCSRTTTGKPKFTNYAHKMAIVDGSNGRTYILMMTDPIYGAFIRIASSDMQHDAPADEIGGDHAVFRDDERYAELARLIESVAVTGGV